ncbi:hypothetical protein [Pseudalkalibacillus decolorationis]|uniref:hypothetical protein n=1 Tax=Pseudalkalibacillus decolorationis TaxID=163879 RepID=UPI002148ABAB|nr:hypothetical protein [Pseudalkalibacillus decolorationis]
MNGAVNQEDNFSSDHWLNSFGLAALVAGRPSTAVRSTPGKLSSNPSTPTWTKRPALTLPEKWNEIRLGLNLNEPKLAFAGDGNVSYKGEIDQNPVKEETLAKYSVSSEAKVNKPDQNIKSVKSITHGIDAEFVSNKLPKGKGFAAEIDHVLDEVGLTKDEFYDMQAKLHTQLTPSELEKMRQVRETVPPLDETSIMQKVLPLNRVDKYLSGDYVTVGGCLARIEDVSDVISSKDVIDSLRLDYDKTPFSPSEGYAVIRFKTNQYEKFGIPYAEELNSSKAIKENEYIVDPQTGHGFTAAENGRIIPEFETKYLDGALPTDGEIYIVKGGTEELVGHYDVFDGRFKPLKEH